MPYDPAAEMRAEIRARDWAAVHIAADRRPWIRGLFPKLGKYRGEGCRRERGNGGFVA